MIKIIHTCIHVYMYKFMYMCIKSNAAAFLNFKMATVSKSKSKKLKSSQENPAKSYLPPEPSQQCDSKLNILFGKVISEHEGCGT